MIHFIVINMNNIIICFFPHSITVKKEISIDNKIDRLQE